MAIRSRRRSRVPTTSRTLDHSPPIPPPLPAGGMRVWPMSHGHIDRRSFMGYGLSAAATVAVGAWGRAAAGPPRRVKVGVIGCGSVSNVYLPHLAKSPHVELVSACDIRPER